MARGKEHILVKRDLWLLEARHGKIPSCSVCGKILQEGDKTLRRGSKNKKFYAVLCFEKTFQD